ncbi:hypothetical protein [Sorangium cellulosum]|uniref:hypothetical protein n=1 Tax=Sorangium cellulosum TaxID=56 RepID=UPI0012FF9EC5|nr:hypothetical protein [Sorangium cellulosum]
MNKEIERRSEQNYREYYSEIEIVDELKKGAGPIIAAVRAAGTPQSATCVMVITGLITLGSQNGERNPVWWLCGMMTFLAFCGLVVVYFTRGNNAEAGKQRNQGPAQSGSVGASSRKTRAGSGIERG